MPEPLRLATGSLALALWCMIPGACWATQHVDVDHSQSKTPGETYRAVAKLTLHNGEPFEIVITNTSPTDFDYEIAGVLAVEQHSEPSIAKAGTPSTTKVIKYKHDSRYGGYVVTVTRKKDSQLSLGNVEITIYVESSGWQIGFGGGFVGSGLIDEKFYVSDPTGGPWSSGETAYLRHDTDAEDAVRLGIASFVHVWHTKKHFNNFALSFGLGLEAGSNITYYVGPSLRLGDKGALTTGLAMGSVATNPAGTGINQEITDPTSIANSQARKNAFAFFLALSYTFIGGAEDDLRKPFASARGAGQ